MEIRKFILDLQPDGSVKWAEVCEPGSISNIAVSPKRRAIDAVSLKRRAIEQINFATSEPDLAYWQGFADGVEALATSD